MRNKRIIYIGVIVTVGFLYISLNIDFSRYPPLEKEQDNNKYEKREEQWNKIVKTLNGQPLYKHLPSVIGIGVEKCGTHALAHFLQPHPMIRISSPMEAHFFDSPQRRKSGAISYRNMMPEAPNGTLTMEKTPAYFSFDPKDTPNLIKKMVPNAKLLLVLCDPVHRVLSDFVQEGIMYTLTGHNAEIVKYKNVDEYLKKYIDIVSSKHLPCKLDKTIKESHQLLDLDQSNYLATILTTGLYEIHLRRWFEVYDDSNLMIINGNEMMKYPGKVIEDIQRFLKIPKLLLREDFVKEKDSGYYCYKDWKTAKLSCLPKAKQRTRGGNMNLSENASKALKDFYKCHNEALYERLGKSFDW